MENYSNGQIWEIACELFKDYAIFQKSHEIATNILAAHGLFMMSKFSHQKALKNMKSEISKRGMKLPETYYDIEISLDDIIKRIEENKALEIEYIKKYSYTWNGYAGNDSWNNSHINAELGANIRISEITRKYDKIIENIKKHNEGIKLKREK